MINRDVVEQYLKANGVNPSASEDEIKEVLFSAKWHQDDIDTALMVLREDPTTHETRVDSVHKVFHSDDRLTPETINSLLGIQVEVSKPGERRSEAKVSIRAMAAVIVIAILMSACITISAMWLLEMGLFYKG